MAFNRKGNNMPTLKPTLRMQTGKKTAKRKPGTGMSPGELKAKTGKTKITRKIKDLQMIKPMKPKPLDRFDKPFRTQKRKKPKA